MQHASKTPCTAGCSCLPVKQAGHVLRSTFQLTAQAVGVASKGMLAALVGCNEEIPLLNALPGSVQCSQGATQLLYSCKTDL